MRCILPASACLLTSVLLAQPAAAQQVTRETIPGITNFARVETTVACAGATKADAIPEIKKMGFASVINLRLSDEPGAEVEKEAAAAQTAGLRYYHVPFDGKPDPAVADRFLTTITTPGVEPAFIYCASGNRAASMWLIKRIAVDHWDVDRASTEATALGLKSPVLKQFAIDYGQSHRQ